MNTLDKIVKDSLSFAAQLLVVGICTAIGVGLMLLLTGCAPAHLSGSGKPAPTPEGFVTLCANNPTFPGCQK